MTRLNENIERLFIRTYSRGKNSNRVRCKVETAPPAFNNLRVTVGAGRADIVVDRADKLNPLDKATVRALREAVDWLESRNDVRVVVVTGDGRAFSAGGDLDGYVTLYRDREAFAAFLEDFFRLLVDIERSAKIYIAAVNGVCVAGGLELLLACDLAIAAADARIGDGHLNFGQLPGAGGSQRLPRAIGAMRARELIFSGRLIDAAEAERIGLVCSVAPEGDLARTVTAQVDRMLAHSARGLSTAKRLVNRGLEMPYEQALRFEIDVVHDYATGDRDATEGLMAFRDKRAPEFSRTLGSRPNLTEEK